MDNKFQVDHRFGEQTIAQRGCVSAWQGDPLVRSSHHPSSPRWRLCGDTRCLGVATKSPRSIHQTLAGKTAYHERQQTDKTGKQTHKKKNNKEVTPPRSRHRLIRTVRGLQPVKGATGGNLPMADKEMLPTSSATFETSR